MFLLVVYSTLPYQLTSKQKNNLNPQLLAIKMQTFRAPSFIYTLWNNPIAAPNFPRHKSGDVKVVYNQKVYSFRAKETGRYSTVIANAAQVEINITSECVKLSDSALDKVMQLLAGIANVEIEGSEVLDALQVMIVLGNCI